MIDYYWLKSFTEIMQLFLSVLFLVYLRLKYDQSSSSIFWLSVFFAIKLATDLYGILNYTSWISTLLTREVLSLYRAAMGAIELGMVASFILFARASAGKAHSGIRVFFYFMPAILMIPINLLLVTQFQGSLLGVFILVKVLWIASLVYVLMVVPSRPLKTLTFFLLVWTVVWLAEVLLHESWGLISEDASWVMFVLAELLLTVGLAYFLLQIIASPKILKREQTLELLPDSLRKSIAQKLAEAFQQDRIFTDPDLSATSLAEHLGVSPQDLTLYLNRGLNKNFNQYLIEFRIEESQRMLQDATYQDWSIGQIMLAAGFNSKSVFNTAFKNKTGLTPSAFRKGNGDV
ncbi:MAG: helix-turn-helix domain-containing protein [Bacteroidota bacterium]